MLKKRLEKAYYNILPAVIMCVLCGCAEIPNKKEENGIHYAIEESDESIIHIVENHTENTNTYLAEGKEGNKCVRRIGDSDNVILIDAVLSDCNVETISLKKAEPFSNAINKDSVIDIFFGGESNVIETNPKEENNTNQDNNGERAVVRQLETTSQMFLDSVDGKIHFSQTAHAGFDYRNDSLVKQYKQIETGGGCFEEQNKDISDSYTVDMAKQNLLETFSKIINIEVRIISCTSIYNETGNGFYSFTFVPVIDNVPLAINDRASDTDAFVDVYGQAEIGKDGIARIQATNFLLKSISSDSETNCLSLEKALVILGEYMKKGEISGSEKITFTRASLVWLPITENWTEVELVPVWRFYIPCVELVESDAGAIAITENVPTDISINAINGKIERAE